MLLVYILASLVSLASGQQVWSRWQPAQRDDHLWSPWDNYDPSVVVRTYYGDVRGFSIPWHVEDLDWDLDRPDWEDEYPPWFIRRINCFLGVPYAQPPVGRYRMMRPRKPRWGGTWEANHYRPACPQDITELQKDIPDFTHANISEDCLYMNVFVPNITWHSRETLYPVIVWIHGGDFLIGSAQTYPGHVLATREVVVVTFNYRLGALGYLTTTDEYASGNWGLFDQHMAIEFVKENIRAFKGDPNLITLAGDGSGAASVGYHLVSPMTRGKNFFHQTIMMSGTDLSMFAWVNPYWQPRKYAVQLGDLMHCNTDDMYLMIECMRDNITHNWTDFVTLQQQVKPFDGPLRSVWAPTQDAGWFQTPGFTNFPYFPQTPADLRDIEEYDKLPNLIGISGMDGAKIANDAMPDLAKGLEEEDMRDFVKQMLVDWNVQEIFHERVIEAVMFQYTYWAEPANDTARTQEFIHMITDLLYGYPMDKIIKKQAVYEPQYMYLWNYHSPNDWVPRWMGASHAGAVPFVFGFPFFNETILNETELVLRNYYDYQDRNMSDWMMHLWTNFAKYSRPTVNETRNITWEPYTFNNLSYLIIDEHSHIWGWYRQNKYGFWSEYFPTIAKQEFYFATPTPAGYGYVISTGALSSLMIILLCGVGVLTFLIWLHGKREREKEEMTDSEIPLSFYPGHSRSQSRNTMSSTPEKEVKPYSIPQPPLPKKTQSSSQQTYNYPEPRSQRPYRYPRTSYRDDESSVYPQSQTTTGTYPASSTMGYGNYPGTGRSRDYRPSSQEFGPPSSRSGSTGSYPYSDNEFSTQTPSMDMDIGYEKRRPKMPPPPPPSQQQQQQQLQQQRRQQGQQYGQQYGRRKKHVPQHSVC